MKTITPFNPTRVHQRGYTLAEVLISLAITAALLMAMGSAFSTAGSAVEVNDRYFRSVQQSRTAMDLVMTELRRCTVINTTYTNYPNTAAPNNTTTYSSITYTHPADGSVLSGHVITIGYNNSSATSNPNTITLTDNTASLATTTVMASNVTNAQFTVMPGFNFALPPVNSIATVSLTMTVQIGNDAVTISGSASPRINLVSLYQ